MWWVCNLSSAKCPPPSFPPPERGQEPGDLRTNRPGSERHTFVPSLMEGEAPREGLAAAARGLVGRFTRTSGNESLCLESWQIPSLRSQRGKIKRQEKPDSSHCKKPLHRMSAGQPTPPHPTPHPPQTDL